MSPQPAALQNLQFKWNIQTFSEAENAGRLILLCGTGDHVGINQITTLAAALALKANEAVW